MVDDPSKIPSFLRVPPRVDDLPLSEKKSHKPSQHSWLFKDEKNKFDFVKGRIFYNDQDLAHLISENLSHLPANYWTHLAKRLNLYRKWVLTQAQDPEELALFAALVQAFLTKIFGRIKKKLDETVDGVAFHFEEEQLLLNGVNVHAFIRLAREKPNKRVKIFLKGLKARMEILLRNQWNNEDYEKIRDVIGQLMQEIDEILTGKKIAAYQAPPVILLKDLNK